MSLMLIGYMVFRHESSRNQSTLTDPVAQSQHTKSDAEVKHITGPDDTMLKRCESELQALKVVSSDDYLRQTALFAKLMSTASQYGNVRSRAAPLIVAAVDALYQYRASWVCTDISWRLLNALF